MRALRRRTREPGRSLGRLRVWAIGMLGILLLAPGCLPPDRAELVVANGPDVEMLDPQIATSTAAGRVFSALFEGLTRLDPISLEVVPGLAERWTREDPAGTVWTFHLREGLRWSDGTPLTAHDVQASWDRLAAPSTGATYAAWVREATVLPAEDGRALQVHFPTPQPLFDRMCAYHALAPIPAALREAPVGTTPDPLPSSGPFRLIERRIRDRIRVEVNPHHWSGTAPAFGTIDFLTLESQFTALNLFLAGDVAFTPSVPDLAVPALRERYPEQFRPTPQYSTYFLRFQQRDAPLDDRDLRLALVRAVDRAEVARHMGGTRQAASGLVPPLLPDYPGVQGPSFDPQEARLALARFLARHGGVMPRLEYLYPSSDFNRTLAEVLQQQWSRHLGVEVALVNQESKTFFPAQRGLEYQISHSSWVGDYLDPTTFLDNFVAGSGNNRTGFASAEYEELLRWAATCGDAALRMELLAEAERLLLQQAVVLPLLVDVDMALVASDLKGLTPNAAGIIDWAAVHR